MRLKLLTIMLSISLYGSAQNYVGLKKEQVVSAYYKEHRDETYETKWDRTADFEYVIFKQGSFWKAYYFNHDELCYLYMALYPYSSMNVMVEALNNKFVKVSDTVWLDYNQYIDYRWELERSDNFFSLKCSILEVH